MCQVMERKVKLENIWEAVKCPVCQKKLRPSLKSCLKGHCVCSACYDLKVMFGRGQFNCPTCNSPFTSQPNINLENVLELLPNQCKHPKCKYISWNVKEHEQLCACRMVTCLICYGSFTPIKLREHVRNNHLYMTCDEDRVISDFRANRLRKKVVTGACLINNQFFWRKLYVDDHVFILKFVCVPVWREFHRSYVTVEFKSCENVYSNTVELCFDSKESDLAVNQDSIESDLTFDVDKLDPFIDAEGNLRYKILIEKRFSETLKWPTASSAFTQF